jgi:methyl-accepting chemotaxis protein
MRARIADLLISQATWSDQSHILQAVLLISLCASSSVTLLMIVLHGQAAAALAFFALALLVIGLAFQVNRRGRFVAATWITLVGLSLTLYASLLLPQPAPLVRALVPYFAGLTVVIAGGLLRPGDSLVAAHLNVVLLVIFVVLSGGPRGLGASFSWHDALGFYVLPAAFWYILAGLSWLFSRYLQLALQRARDDARSLQEQLRINEGLVAQLQHHLAENERLMARLSETADQLDPAAQSLTSLLEQMSAAGTQIASTATQMAQGADRQAQRVEATSHSIARLAEATHHIAANVQITDASAIQARLLVDSASASLQELSGKSREIKRVVALVEKFADHTNLLALNAAIEAARAGQNGRSFAVLAEEIRRLAEHSAASVLDIARLSEEIDERAATALSSMVEVVEAVDQATRQAEETSHATDRQTAAAEEMVQASNEVAAVAEQNAAGAQQVSIAVAQQMMSIKQITAAAQELATLAARLHQAGSSTAPAVPSVSDNGGGQVGLEPLARLAAASAQPAYAR